MKTFLEVLPKKIKNRIENLNKKAKKSKMIFLSDYLKEDYLINYDITVFIGENPKIFKNSIILKGKEVYKRPFSDRLAFKVGLWITNIKGTSAEFTLQYYHGNKQDLFFKAEECLLFDSEEEMELYSSIKGEL